MRVVRRGPLLALKRAERLEEVVALAADELQLGARGGLAAEERVREAGRGAGNAGGNEQRGRREAGVEREAAAAVHRTSRSVGTGERRESTVRRRVIQKPNHKE